MADEAKERAGSEALQRHLKMADAIRYSALPKVRLMRQRLVAG
jgi:hypothetical protein